MRWIVSFLNYSFVGNETMKIVSVLGAVIPVLNRLCASVIRYGNLLMKITCRWHGTVCCVWPLQCSLAVRRRVFFDECIRKVELPYWHRRTGGQCIQNSAIRMVPVKTPTWTKSGFHVNERKEYEYSACRMHSDKCRRPRKNFSGSSAAARSKHPAVSVKLTTSYHRQLGRSCVCKLMRWPRRVRTGKCINLRIFYTILSLERELQSGETDNWKLFSPISFRVFVKYTVR